MRTLLLAVSIAVVVALASWGAPLRTPTNATLPVQHQCFPPGTTGVDGFEMCPEGYYAAQVSV